MQFRWLDPKLTCAALVASVLYAGTGAALAAEADIRDFSLSFAGRTFRLSEHRGEFVAVHFLLKTECPMCGKFVREIVRNGPSVAGVRHIFLKPDAESDVNAFREKLGEAGKQVALFRDADAALAKELKIPDGYEFHGERVHYPATVLFGPDGREVFRYVGQNNTDRLPFDKLASIVTERSRGPALSEYNVKGSEPALAGYDPVAYFDGQPAKGDPALSSTYRGVNYLFSNAERRARFAATPDAFLPEYGGWCATAIAEGKKVEVDPLNYKITHKRLFLFYKGWLGDALKDWNKAEPKLTEQADTNWKKIAPGDPHRGA